MEKSKSIEQEIIKYVERVITLEAKFEVEKKSLLNKLGKWGGLMALVISLFTGGYTVYDNFFLKPSDKMQSALGEARKIVTRISDLNSKLIELQSEGEFQKLKQIGMIFNGEKVALLNQADNILKEYWENIGYSELMVLAFEHLNMGNNEKSLKFSIRASEIAENDILKIEALRYKARVLFVPGSVHNIKEARNAISKALQMANNIIYYNKGSIVSNIYMDYINNEIYFGSCDKAKKLKDEAIDLIDNLIINLNERMALLSAINQYFFQQSKCEI